MAISITIQVLHGMNDGEAIVHFTPLWNSAIAESPTFSWRKRRKKREKGKEKMYCNEKRIFYIYIVYALFK